MVGLLRDYRYVQYYDNPGHEYYLWYSYSQTVFKQDEFTRLLGLLPNLKILDLKDSIKPEHYMKYLQDINSCQHLQHIKKITANYIGYHLNSKKQTAKKQLYLSTYRSFASTLTSLELSCSVGVFSQDDLSILCEFKKLMALSLDRPQVVSIMLSDILDCCPKLKRLVYTCSNREDGGSRLPDLTAQLDYPIASPTNNCLEYSELHIPSLPLPLIKYLTICLPDTVKEIKILIYEENMLNWIEAMGMSKATAFAKPSVKSTKWNLKY